jgi:hypothetical protein
VLQTCRGGRDPHHSAGAPARRKGICCYPVVEKRMTVPRSIAGPLCLALWGVACGTPGSVSPTQMMAPTAPTLQIYVTGPERFAPGSGLQSPLSLTLHVTEPSGLGGSIEAASSKVQDSEGTVLAEAQLLQPTSIPAGGFGEVRQQLVWSSGTPGRRVDVSVTVMDGHGDRRTIGYAVGLNN